jgi:hypothetical protein
MTPLANLLRNQLESVIKDARSTSEAGSKSVLQEISVGDKTPFKHLNEEKRELRRRLRAHGRQLGDKRYSDGFQELDL